MKTLVLEHESIVRMDIERQLLKLGCEITSDASNGPFDVIIVGQFHFITELLKKRLIKIGTSLVFFTTFSDNELPTLTLSNASTHIFSKPHQFDTMIRYIGSINHDCLTH